MRARCVLANGWVRRGVRSGSIRFILEALRARSRSRRADRVRPVEARGRADGDPDVAQAADLRRQAHAADGGVAEGPRRAPEGPELGEIRAAGVREERT